MTSDAVEVLILCLEEQLGTSAEPCSSIYRAVLVSLSSTMTSLQGLEIKVLSSIFGNHDECMVRFNVRDCSQERYFLSKQSHFFIEKYIHLRAVTDAQ